MSFKKYLYSKLYTLCFIALAAVIVCSAMLISDTGILLPLFTFGGIVMLTLIMLITGCALQNKRMRELDKTISQLKDKYLLGELLPEPKNAAEEYYFQVIKTISRSCIGEAERAVRDKEEYCDYVEAWIHEMKTPLTACSLILENGGDAAKLRRELKRADNLTACILYYARMRSPEKDIIIRSIDVSEVIDCAIKEQMSLLIAAGISIENEGSFTVPTDAKALAFILGQLLVNSAKYCPGCKITITAKNGVLTFADNGVGIPSHELVRITERGFTGETGRKNGASTGMGLYIVAGLCEHLNIEMKTESEVNVYTRFTFNFTSLTKT